MTEETPIRCLLVDDEYFALELMENYLNRLGGCCIIDKIRNPLTAFRLLEKEPADILFLDIQMPNLNGFVLFNNLLVKPVTIFTTAYSEYAARAFDADAADYLLKPFSFERFCKAMNKAKKILKEGNVPTDSILQVREGGRWVNIRHQDILYIEGWKEYLRIHCRQQVFTTLMSFSRLEELLPAKGFIRIHKSYMVAANKVSWVGNDELEAGGIRLPVARGRKEFVQEMLVKKEG